MAYADDYGERTLFATFEKYDQFLDYHNQFLSVDLEVQPSSDEDKEEIALLSKLTQIVRRDLNLCAIFDARGSLTHTRNKHIFSTRTLNSSLHQLSVDSSVMQVWLVMTHRRRSLRAE